MAEKETQTAPATRGNVGPTVDRSTSADYIAYKNKFRGEPKKVETKTVEYQVSGQTKVKTYRVMTFKDGVIKKVLVSTKKKK